MSIDYAKIMNQPSPLSQGIISGERVLGAEAFREQVLRAAAGFSALGVERGECVALLLRNDLAFLVASLAAARIGAYAVPINWHAAAEEAAYILADCSAKVLVAHADLLAGVAAIVPAAIPLLIVETPPEIRVAYHIDAAAAGIPATATAWDAWLSRQDEWKGIPVPMTQSMIYTSGTTGHPKAVRRDPSTPEQERKIDAMRSVVFGIRPGARVLLPGPLYHAAPNAYALRAARQAEMLVLMPRFDPEEFLRLVARHRISTVFMVPIMFVRLLQLPQAARRRHDMSSLQFVLHAGAPCQHPVKVAMIEWWGPIIYEYYGSTESGPITMSNSAEYLAHPGSVGRCIPGTTVRIYDDAGCVLPPGKTGEIFMRIRFYPDFTYHRQPDKRREIERDGLISCGDVGYFDNEGYLYICDRKRDMVISGGVNIYPAEIEAVLQQMEGVKDSAVFGIPDPEFGEALMAVVEPQEHHMLSVESIQAHLRQHLAGFKVPRNIEVRRDLPREDSGKIFKYRLRAPYWENAGRSI